MEIINGKLLKSFVVERSQGGCCRVWKQGLENGGVCFIWNM